MARNLRILAASVIGIGPIPVHADTERPLDSAVEAPELGRAGPHAVGTTERELELPKRVQLTGTGPSAVRRNLSVRLWYPATAETGERAIYRHSLQLRNKSEHEVVERGNAYPGASALPGKYPLVLISHGFGGWSEQLSRLGEHLASRGYVVAAIDHRDAAFDSMQGFFTSFGNVLINRSLDQRQVLDRLLEPSLSQTVPALKSVDKSNVALIGYSMGGFGALATAGAGYDPNGSPFAQLPAVAKAPFLESTASGDDRIKALVLIAPWGGQPDSRAWSAQSLASMAKPMLMIAGDQDDIVDYRTGVRWLFDGLAASERYLLVYREARHNVAGNAVVRDSLTSSEATGYLLEPVWRQERINDINEHFVTAFLDAMLKGDQPKRRYLDVPNPVASDGKWPSAFGATDDGVLAGDGQPEYWRGFPRRWATGLELHRKVAAKTGKLN